MAPPLLFASIIPDLLSFSPLLRIITLLFGAFVIVFSILDFNVLIHHQSRSVLKWTNDRADGVELWRRVFMAMSGIASFTGAVCVILVAKGKYSNYLWGIANCVTYGVFAFAYGYAGDAQLNIIFYLPLQFVGIYMWSRNLDLDRVAVARSLGVLQWIGMLVLSLALAVAFYYEIPAFARALTGEYFFAGLATPRRVDAATNALSVGAQILMLTGYWEQWVFWIAVDVLQIIMYSGAIGVDLNVNVLLMFILFLCNAFFGCYTWYHRSRDLTKPASQLVTNPAVTASMETPSSGSNHDTDNKHLANHQIQDLGNLPPPKNERGLVIGKFWPPHHGHTYLIEYALVRCNHLSLIVCERPDRNETPTGIERRDWFAQQ